MISAILDLKAGGEKIFLEFAKTKSLSDSTRRLLVNMLVADMIEKHGRVPPSSVCTKHALGIVTLLPYLKDPDSSNGYEHYCDAESGSGYLAWRIKTVQRNTSHGTKKRSMSTYQDGPKAKRASHSTVDECREAISVLQHSTDESLVKEKMRATFKHRQNIVQDPEKSSTILGVFPRFLDIPGLIDQDFTMLFGEDASGKFLAKWPTLLRPGSSQTARTYPPVPIWKPSSLLCSTTLMIWVGTSMVTFLAQVGREQPFLLCVGEQKNIIQIFYIVVDQKAIPVYTLMFPQLVG
ncbi:uncharacterized protein LOC117409960 [Acipenser ruthenus]|uniref:uncharacterized protein LOC117409960 n=1 Tax=Acipenser ruthenus TaxID=7906 RepID=UPI00274037F1|nr:uncharacterized protein LOC117409960 [Acipenser ruthenus]